MGDRFSHVSENMATSSGVKGDDGFRRLHRRLPVFNVNNTMISLSQGKNDAHIGNGCHGNGEEDDSRTSMDNIYGNGDACRTTLEVIGGKRDTWGGNLVITGCKEDNRRATKDDGGSVGCVVRGEYVSRSEKRIRHSGDVVFTLHSLPNSSHRDGSIYRNLYTWKEDFCIADRNETRIEAMLLSDPTDCVYAMNKGICLVHHPSTMLQIFALKVAHIFVDGDSFELYGYVAARDDLDPHLNYLVNISRDDPIIVQQGSCINMSGPKRGIELMYATLIEYDLKIKTGEQEKHDLQLIDGVSEICYVNMDHCVPFTGRIYGDYGAVEITVSRLDDAIEATVEVLISDVQTSFNLCLGCFTNGIHKEIRLFDGTISEPCGLNRHVVALMLGTSMDFKIKESAGSSSQTRPAGYCCSFKANNHGHTTHELKTKFALVSVKVTWSRLPKSSSPQSL